VLKDVKIWSVVRENNFLFPKKEDRIANRVDSIANNGDSIAANEDNIADTEDLFPLTEDNLAAAGTVLATNLHHIHARGMATQVNLHILCLQHRPAEQVINLYG